MDRAEKIVVLKRLIQQDVKYLCWRADRRWNAPIVHMLRELRSQGAKAVFFGGALRSLILSRLINGRLGRPRDLDIVVEATTMEQLRCRFQNSIYRETRFGGLQLRRSNWHFDIWPLDRTWAFVQEHIEHPTFQELPKTTFFNLEAIAVEVWPTAGTPRVTFSGDDQFFDGILNRTLEINLDANPFPALCVVRALVLASANDLAIGPRLARYLVTHSRTIGKKELTAIQVKHYGRLRVEPEEIQSWLAHIYRKVDENSSARLRLPLLRQRSFWPEYENHGQVFRKDAED